MDLCFATFVFLTFRGPLASHDSNPYPNRSRIARYNATKFGNPAIWGVPIVGWSRMSGRRMSGTSRRFPRHFLKCVIFSRK